MIMLKRKGKRLFSPRETIIKEFKNKNGGSCQYLGRYKIQSGCLGKFVYLFILLIYMKI